MRYQVLLVNDHRLIREGIKALIEQSSEFQAIAETRSGNDALWISKRIGPDLIVVDAGSPGLKSPATASR